MTTQDIDQLYQLQDLIDQRIERAEQPRSWYIERIDQAAQRIGSRSERIRTLLERIADDLEYRYRSLDLMSARESWALQWESDFSDIYESRLSTPITAEIERAIDEDEFPDWPLAVYIVNENGNLQRVAWSTDNKDLFKRNLIANSVYDPASHRIQWVIIYNNSESDTSAYVAPLDSANETWLLAINTDWYLNDEYIDTVELMMTLVHEYAHVYSLNAEQVDASVLEEECSTIYLQEWCVNSETILHTFITTFRSYEDFKVTEHGAAWADESYNQEEFVTWYAATNAVEDFAESYAHYMLSAEIYADDTLVHQKLKFFDQFPELQKKREQSRALMLRLIEETIW